MAMRLRVQKKENELRQVFHQLDTNGDNCIQQKEFVDAYVKLNLTRKDASTEAIKLFQAADTDKNGIISFAEWCRANITMD